MRIVTCGTYDTGKPRVRILLRGLRENGVELIECHWELCAISPRGEKCGLAIA